MNIKSWYVGPNDIVYDYDKEEYYLVNIPTGRQALACNLNTKLDVIYDQAYRSLYYNFDYQVIYSHHFYSNIKKNSIYFTGFFN